MATPEDFDDQPLLNSCRKGDEDAARELFDNYAERLLLLVRRRLSQRLASRFGPEDVLQSVFRTFFRRAQQGQFSLFAEAPIEDRIVLGDRERKRTRRASFPKSFVRQRVA
jgi:hypothetical protein